MFQKNSKVEDGRVRAHETAEAASLKVHEIIDKVAEHTEHGSAPGGRQQARLPLRQGRGRGRRCRRSRPP